MGFVFRMGDYGADSVDIIGKAPLLDETIVTEVEYFCITADSENARSADCTNGIRIVGKLNYDLAVVAGEGVNPQKDIVDWAMTESHEIGAYRHVIVSVIASDQVVREYDFTEAYVVNYEESQDESNGVGQFELILRQKKDTNADVAVSSSFINELK